MGMTMNPCGHWSQPGVVACPVCGRPTLSAPTPPAPRRSGRAGPALAVLLVLAVAAAVGWFALGSFSGSESASGGGTKVTGSTTPASTTTTEAIPGPTPEPERELKPGIDLLPPASVKRYPLHSAEAGIWFATIDEYPADYVGRQCKAYSDGCPVEGYKWTRPTDEDDDPWPAYGEKVYFAVEPGATEEDGVENTAGSAKYRGERHPIEVDGFPGTRQVIVDEIAGTERIWNTAFVPTPRGLLVVAVMSFRVKGAGVPPIEPLLSTIRIDR